MAANIEAKITETLTNPDLGEDERAFLEDQLKEFHTFNTREGQAAGAVSSVTREFSQGALKDLKRNKAYVFDHPFNTSLSRLVAEDRPFWYITNRSNVSFMNTLSRLSKVAIFPEANRFYVPESNNLSLDGQKRRQKEDLEEEIKGKMRIGGVEMIIGDVATHAGLTFAYFDKTRRRVRLHGANYGYKYARTETPTVGSGVAGVGSFSRVGGLDVLGWSRDSGSGGVWALRLVVPAQE